MTDVDSAPAGNGTLTDPTVAQWALTRELRRLYDTNNLTFEKLAAAVRVTKSTARRWILGEKSLTYRDVRDLCEAFGADDATTARLLALSDAAKGRGIVQRLGWQEVYDIDLFAALENAAKKVSTYETSLIPGLLQTAAYAAAVIGDTVDDPEGVAERVKLRLARQVILTRDEPAELHAIVSEAALRWGTPEILVDQLERLLAVAALPNVTIQVLSFDQNPVATGSTGSFHVLSLGDPIGHIAYQELPDRACYLETDRETEPYLNVFRHCATRALSPDASVAKISAVLAEKRTA